MSITGIISLLSGVALFLFGMSLMGDGLKRVAGSKLELTLYRLSGTPIRAVALGAGVTTVIQSSSATSVMVIGFVNSNLMKLRQAIGIILGAILGTSITGWILCLSELSDSTSTWLSLLSTSSLTGMVAIVGIIIRMVSKKVQNKHLGDILLGFAVLMTGMQTMASAVEPLRSSEVFINIITEFSNPIVGILAGAAITCIIQSASAAVGILQALAMTGAIDFALAFPMILGISMGAALPVLISSVGSSTEAKRSAWSYLLINISGTILFGTGFYLWNAIAPVSFFHSTLNTVGIAGVNTLYRLGMVLVLAPLIPQIEKLSKVIIRQEKNDENDMEEIDRLEDRFLLHPTLAVEQSRIAICSMARKTEKNLNRAFSLLNNYSEEKYNRVNKKEEVIDKYEDRLGTYLVKLTAKEMTEEENSEVSKFLHTVSDFERIADRACNLANTAKEIAEKNITFSEDAQYELAITQASVKEIVHVTFEAFSTDNYELASHTEPLEQVIDGLCDELKFRHISRVQKGECTLELGFVFNDIITNYERIADHCSNVAVAMIELKKNTFDTHEYLNDIKRARDEKFSHLYDEYAKEFFI